MNGGSGIDNNKLRGRGSMSRYSPAKRQMGLSSSASMVGKNGCDADDSIIGDIESDRVTEKSKKEGVRGLKWRSVGVNGDVERRRSEGHEGNYFGSESNSVAGGVTGRKRVKLHEKVESGSVDPAPVPRKLRSAMNKHSKQSVSPPLSNEKKKSLHTSNWAQVLCANGVTRSDDRLLIDSITEDEKAVVQALFKLSGLAILQPSPIVKEQKESLESNADTGTASTPLEVSNKENNIELSSDVNGSKVVSFSVAVKLNDESGNADVVSAKPMSNSESQTSKPDLNLSIQSDDHAMAFSSRNDDLDTTKVQRNKVSSPTNFGVLHDCYYENSAIKMTQQDAFLLGSASAGCDTKAVEHISNKNILCHEGPTSYCEANAPTVDYGKQTIKCGHSRVTNSSRSTARGNGISTKKLPQKAQSVTQLRKNCATHLFISHLIRDRQDLEKQQSLSLSSDKLESRREMKLSVDADHETSRIPNDMSSIPSTRNVSLTEKSIFGGGNVIDLEDEDCPPMKPPAVSVVPETHSQQKQVHDFLSCPTGAGAGGSGNWMTSLGQVPSSFLHPQAPHHSIMQFPFPHIPYAANSAPVASSQVHLHVPHYVANTFYGQQMANMGSSSKLQQQYQQQHQHQQMWEAHLAHYRQQMGAQLTQKVRLQDLNGQTPPSSVPPSTAINLHGVSYNPTLIAHQQHTLPTGSMTPSRNKIHQHHQPNGLCHEEPPKLQLLCNAQR